MRQNILKIFFVAAIVVFTLCGNAAEVLSDTSSAGTNKPEQVTFSLSNSKYTLSLPEGFCTVSGKDIEVAEATAALDTRNMTHFTFIPCEEAGQEVDFTMWGMLKTPRGSIGKRVPTRQKWTADAKKSIKRGDFVEIFNDAEKLAGKTYKDVFGDKAKIGMHMELVDADKYAGYMTGTMSIEIAGEKKVVAGAGAMTIVRNNVFFYYRYGPYNNLSDLAVILKQVKSDISRFVIENPD